LNPKKNSGHKINLIVIAVFTIAAVISSILLANPVVKPLNFEMFTSWENVDFPQDTRIHKALYAVYLGLIPLLACVRFISYQESRLWLYFSSLVYQLTLAIIPQLLILLYVKQNMSPISSAWIPEYAVYYTYFHYISYIGIIILMLGNVRTTLRLWKKYKKPKMVESTIIDSEIK
jgi:hypothetical protein